jgi:putative glycosyltransferase (TIGR04372 family)
MLPSSRIGHFAANIEVYLCERDAGMHGQRIIDIFYHQKPICNYQLKMMWDRILRVSGFARPMDWLNRHLPGGKKHIVPWRDDEDRDIYGLLSGTQPHLSFTAEEEKKGYEELRKVGIPDGTRFVCLHARDTAYLNETFPEWKWDYHNYRDSDVNQYIPAAEELAKRGYYVLRMGAKQNKPLKTDNPHIIDYGTKFRTDFLDIYLGAKCFFYVGDTSGLFAIPYIFRNPLVIVNLIPLEYIPSSKTFLSIPKKLWLRKEHRLMTFREILESGAGRFLHTEQYEQMGLDIVDNTPEEITAVVIEMDERLKGTWKTTEEDEELQRMFWSLFKPSKLHGIIKGRIGADFLRQNKDLLR